MRVLIIAMGPGETSQGVAIARYFLDQGESVHFVVLKESLLEFLKGLNCTSEYLSEPEIVKRQIDRARFDLTIFCNSKIFANSPQFQYEAPENKPLCVSLDSNWLFDHPERFPFIRWLDQVYVNLPKEIFEKGLIENGGNYSIPAKIREMMEPIGLVPSYNPLLVTLRSKIRRTLGLADDEKLIFAYGGSNSTFRPELRELFCQVMEKLNQEGVGKVRGIFFGGEIESKSWLLPVSDGAVSSSQFYEYLACSDLVFQHQGLGTLEQAISANVPVIANVRTSDNQDHQQLWEVESFAKVGVCSMFVFGDKIDQVVSRTFDLLFDEQAIVKMILAQRDIYEAGESVLYESTKRMIDGNSIR